MKAWFARTRITLAQFTTDNSKLDQALKETAPKRQAPPSLHRSIMVAVRSAERPAPAPHVYGFLQWFPGSALVALALLIAWHVQRGQVRQPAPDAQSLATATTALEMGGQMAQAMPSAVVAPLAIELERVSRDLDNTAQFLLASLP